MTYKIIFGNDICADDQQYRVHLAQSHVLSYQIVERNMYWSLYTNTVFRTEPPNRVFIWKTPAIHTLAKFEMLRSNMMSPFIPSFTTIGLQVHDPTAKPTPELAWTMPYPIINIVRPLTDLTHLASHGLMVDRVDMFQMSFI